MNGMVEGWWKILASLTCKKIPCQDRYDHHNNEKKKRDQKFGIEA
jgi:hypothetical protein